MAKDNGEGEQKEMKIVFVDNKSALGEREVLC
jgi:hypothetical protein